MAMASISREDMAELFGETYSDDEQEQLSEYSSQVEEANQGLWLVDRQQGSEDAHRGVDSLTAELGGAWRLQAGQQSKYSLQVEYLEQDLEVQKQTADDALRQLRHQKHDMAAEMGKVQAELQAQQTHTAGLLHALHQEQSRCAWQEGCITHLTQQLASLQAEVTQLTAAQASRVEQVVLQTQNNAKREHLERVNDYQAAELMTLQRHIYQLRSLMAAHGLDPALASEVPAVSPWFVATTPEHLWDTSSTSMTPPSSSTQGLSSTQELSPAPESQGLSHTAAFMPCGSSTSSAQELKVASAGLTATSPAQAGGSAGRHYAPAQHSLHAGSRSRIFSGCPMAGLGRTGPLVRMTRKQQARQDAAAAALSRSTSVSAATASGTRSTPASAHHLAGAPVVMRRPDSTPGSAATPSAPACKPSSRTLRGSCAGGSPLLSTGRRPSLRGSKSCMIANLDCHSNRDTISKGNSCSSANKENSPGTGKTRTPATSSLQVMQQQPLASRALLQLTPFSPTVCKSPLAPMANGDETPSSPGYAQLLRGITVPYLGSPAPLPVAPSGSFASTSATPIPAAAVMKQLPTDRKAADTLGTATPAALASTAAAPATAAASFITRANATTGAGGVPMALHPVRDPTARALEFADTEEAAAAAPEAADVSMDDSDVNPTSPGFSPHALQLRAIPVPFWGLPAPVSVPAAADDCASAEGTSGIATAAATVPVSAAAPPATATAAALPDQTLIARALQFLDAEQAAAPAASVELSQACLPKPHAERQRNPLLSFDVIGAASMPFQAPASSAATSSQYIISDRHAAHSPPRHAMVAASADAPLAAGDVSPKSPGSSLHALQLRATTVPFWGELAASPLAAADNSATAANTADFAMPAAAAPASPPAPPATCVPAPAAAVTASVSAAFATQATATTAAGSVTPAVLPDQAQLARALHLTDAEQATAPAATVEPSQAHGLNAQAEKQHCASSSIAGILSAAIAKGNQPRGSTRRTLLLHLQPQEL